MTKACARKEKGRKGGQLAGMGRWDGSGGQAQAHTEQAITQTRDGL